MATQKSWRGLGSEAEANEEAKAKTTKATRNWTPFIVIKLCIMQVLLPWWGVRNVARQSKSIYRWEIPWISLFSPTWRRYWNYSQVLIECLSVINVQNESFNNYGHFHMFTWSTHFWNMELVVLLVFYYLRII